MPPPPTGDERIMVDGAEMWRSTYTLRVFGTNRCTDAVIVIDVVVTLDVTAHMAGEDAEVLVVASLESTPSPSALGWAGIIWVIVRVLMGASSVFAGFVSRLECSLYRQNRIKSAKIRTNHSEK